MTVKRTGSEGSVVVDSGWNPLAQPFASFCIALRLTGTLSFTYQAPGCPSGKSRARANAYRIAHAYHWTTGGE